jgi:hypothetical protein
MDEIVDIIGSACLKHHDSGETSVNREARVIIKALGDAGYIISKAPVFELAFCPYCLQMTNHIENVCQKHKNTEPES